MPESLSGLLKITPNCEASHGNRRCKRLADVTLRLFKHGWKNPLTAELCNRDEATFVSAAKARGITVTVINRRKPNA